MIATRDPNAVMGSFAADHLIRDPDSWVGTVQQAVRGAEQGMLMTVGITPTRAETGYGYLETGDPTEGVPWRPVAEFKEKPAAEVAEAYVRSGRHLWNASMFVWRVDVFLAELARQQPGLHAGVTAIAAAWGTLSRTRSWRDLADPAEDLRRLRGDGGRGHGGSRRDGAGRLRLERRR